MTEIAAPATLYFSNMNLRPEFFLPDSPVGALLAPRIGLGSPRGSVDAHVEMLYALNDDTDGRPRYRGGYDFTPSRALTASLQKDIAKGTFSNDAYLSDPESRLIGAGRESWSPGLPTGILRALRQRNLGPLERTAAMVERWRSLEVLRALKPALGPIPVTVAGDAKYDGEYIDYGLYFSPATALVKPELYKSMMGSLDLADTMSYGDRTAHYKQALWAASHAAGSFLASFS